MIKKKTSYVFRGDNLLYLINNTRNIIPYLLVHFTTFIPMVLLPDDMVVATFVILIQICAVMIVILRIIDESKFRKLPIIQKHIYEYEYKEKIISYFKFEKKYSKTKQ